MKPIARGYAFVICSAAIYGCMPLGAELLYTKGLTPLSLVFYRNVLGLLPLACLAKMRGENLRLSFSELWKVGLLGLLNGCITPILLYSAYQHMSSGSATVFHYIYPSVVILGGVLLFGEKVRKKESIGVLLCMMGILFFQDPGGDVSVLGGILALLSGVSYGFYILLLPKYNLTNISCVKLSFWMAAICAVTTLPICFLLNQFFVPTDFSSWSICVLFSLLLCVGAVILLQRGIFLIGGQRAAIMSTLEPVISILIGIAIFGDQLTVRTCIGSIIVIASAGFLAIFDSQKEKLL